MDEESDQYWCGYYYVSHSTRDIFWLEKRDISELFMEAETEVSEPHISEFRVSSLLLCIRLKMGHVEIQMEYQYW